MAMTTPASPTLNRGLWSEDEHERFLAAIDPFISWDHVARCVGTRSRLQCRSHNQKIEKKMKNACRGVRAAPRREHRLPSSPALAQPSFVPPTKELVAMPEALKKPVSPPGVDETEILTGVSSVSWANLFRDVDPTHDQCDELLRDCGLDMDIDFPESIDLLGDQVPDDASGHASQIA